MKKLALLVTLLIAPAAFIAAQTAADTAAPKQEAAPAIATTAPAPAVAAPAAAPAGAPAVVETAAPKQEAAPAVTAAPAPVVAAPAAVETPAVTAAPAPVVAAQTVVNTAAPAITTAAPAPLPAAKTAVVRKAHAAGSGAQQNKIKAVEDPAAAQRRAEMDAKIKARMEAENAFRKSLEGKTPAEQEAALSAHRDQQKQEAAAAREQQHQDAVARLKETLAKNTTMTDAQKADQVNQFEKNYRDNLTKQEQRQKEAAARMEAENAFRKSLEGKTPAEREAALSAHRDEAKKAAAAAREQQHQDALAQLKDNLSKNTSLTDAQKTEQINQFEKNYADNLARQAQREAEMQQRAKDNQAFMDSIKNLPPDQRQAAMKAHAEQQRAARKSAQPAAAAPAMGTTAPKAN